MHECFNSLLFIANGQIEVKKTRCGRTGDIYHVHLDYNHTCAALSNDYDPFQRAVPVI